MIMEITPLPIKKGNERAGGERSFFTGNLAGGAKKKILKTKTVEWDSTRKFRRRWRSRAFRPHSS